MEQPKQVREWKGWYGMASALGQMGSCGWVATGRVTEAPLSWDGWLLLISGVVVVQDRHYQSLWSLLGGCVAG